MSKQKLNHKGFKEMVYIVMSSLIGCSFTAQLAIMHFYVNKKLNQKTNRLLALEQGINRLEQNVQIIVDYHQNQQNTGKPDV